MYEALETLTLEVKDTQRDFLLLVSFLSWVWECMMLEIYASVSLYGVLVTRTRPYLALGTAFVT
jgi:hypothetical protein